MMTMSRFFRRLSLRKPKFPLATKTMASPNSCPNLHDSRKNERSKCPLTEETVFKCLDSIDNPFELARFRRVNRLFKGYVDQRFSNVTEMDVRRVALDSISMSSCGSESSCSSSTSSVPVLLNQKTWYLHPAGHKVGLLA